MCHQKKNLLGDTSSHLIPHLITVGIQWNRNPTARQATWSNPRAHHCLVCLASHCMAEVHFSLCWYCLVVLYLTMLKTSEFKFKLKTEVWTKTFWIISHCVITHITPVTWLLKKNRYIWVQNCKVMLIHVFSPYTPGSDILTDMYKNNAIHVLQSEELNCGTAQEPRPLFFQKLYAHSKHW